MVASYFLGAKEQRERERERNREKFDRAAMAFCLDLSTATYLMQNLSVNSFISTWIPY
jgi:hypothetical protein